MMRTTPNRFKAESFQQMGMTNPNLIKQRALRFLQRVKSNPKNAVNYWRFPAVLRNQLDALGFNPPPNPFQFKGNAYPNQLVTSNSAIQGLGESEDVKNERGELTYEFGDNLTSKNAIDVKDEITKALENAQSNSKIRYPKNKCFYQVYNITLNAGDVINILDFDIDRTYLRIINDPTSLNRLDVLFRVENNTGVTVSYPDAIHLATGGVQASIFEPVRRVPINGITLHNATANALNIVNATVIVG